MQNNQFTQVFKSGENTIYNSLLPVLIGIFLLPNIAFASLINTENIIDLTNEERIKTNAPVLNENNVLNTAAHNKAADILKTGLFQHNIGERKFSSWVKEAGYSYSYVGENLAMDFETSEGMIRAWLESPTHRQNLLNSDFKEIGVAVVNGRLNNTDTTLVVQIFGTPFPPEKNISIAANTIRGTDDGYTAAAQPAITLETVVTVKAKPVAKPEPLYNKIIQAGYRQPEYENYILNSTVLGSAEQSSPPVLKIETVEARYNEIIINNFKGLPPFNSYANFNGRLPLFSHTNGSYYFLLGLLLIINLAALYLHYYNSPLHRKK